jgi:U3 small nucleolar RNA-associated protein 20
VKHVKSHTMDTDQLRILLTYAEQALNDSTQQSIAFGVLKAVIQRKLELEELPNVMLRLSHLAIHSEAGPVRAQCKQVVLQYLIDYPLKKKILPYLESCLAQLEYEKEMGRLSAIEFLISVFKEFPKNLLSQQSKLFFVTMSPRLVNETSTSCVKAVAAGLRILIQRLNTKTNNVLFEVND